MKAKFFTIAAAIVLILGLSATASKAQNSSGGSNGSNPPNPVFSVKCFPNPTPDFIHIETTMPKQLDETVKIEIMDMMGQVLYLYGCIDCNGASIHTVNVKNWAPALYHIRVTYKNNVKWTKFIKIAG